MLRVFCMSSCSLSSVRVWQNSDTHSLRLTGRKECERHNYFLCYFIITRNDVYDTFTVCHKLSKHSKLCAPLFFFSWSLKNSWLLMLWFVTCRGWWHLEIIWVCLDPLSACMSVRLHGSLFHLLLNIVLMQAERVHAALGSNINKQ